MFKSTILEGHHKNEIIRYSSEFHKAKETQQLFLFIIKQVLQSVSFFELLERISESGEIFLRLNKQQLISDGSFTLDTTSDVYKIVIKFLFFNKKIDKIQEITNFLQEIKQSIE